MNEQTRSITQEKNHTQCLVLFLDPPRNRFGECLVDWECVVEGHLEFINKGRTRMVSGEHGYLTVAVLPRCSTYSTHCYHDMLGRLVPFHEHSTLR